MPHEYTALGNALEIDILRRLCRLVTWSGLNGPLYVSEIAVANGEPLLPWKMANSRPGMVVCGKAKQFF
jgi:hypothetical protein